MGIPKPLPNLVSLALPAAGDESRQGTSLEGARALSNEHATPPPDCAVEQLSLEEREQGKFVVAKGRRLAPSQPDEKWMSPSSEQGGEPAPNQSEGHKVSFGSERDEEQAMFSGGPKCAPLKTSCPPSVPSAREAAHSARRVRRKQPGRPRKAEDVRRSTAIDVALSQAELLVLRGLAGRAGLPLRAYVRAAALGCRIRATVPSAAFAAAAELHRVGVNINQVAHALHRTGQLTPADRATFDGLRALLNKIALAMLGEEAEK